MFIQNLHEKLYNCRELKINFFSRTSTEPRAKNAVFKEGVILRPFLKILKGNFCFLIPYIFTE